MYEDKDESKNVVPIQTEPIHAARKTKMKTNSNIFTTIVLSAMIGYGVQRATDLADQSMMGFLMIPS